MNTLQKVLLKNVVEPKVAEPKVAELISDQPPEKGRLFKKLLNRLCSLFTERPFDSHASLQRYRLEKIAADNRHYFNIRY